jgi:hypothetical protein
MGVGQTVIYQMFRGTSVNFGVEKFVWHWPLGPPSPWLYLLKVKTGCPPAKSRSSRTIVTHAFVMFCLVHESHPNGPYTTWDLPFHINGYDFSNGHLY